MLWANNLAMRFLPKAWLDVATSVHFYEAVLATLAIVVWHFYSVFSIPTSTRLNTAFLTGDTVKQDDRQPRTLRGRPGEQARPRETDTHHDAE